LLSEKKHEEKPRAAAARMMGDCFFSFFAVVVVAIIGLVAVHCPDSYYPLERSVVIPKRPVRHAEGTAAIGKVAPSKYWQSSFAAWIMMVGTWTSCSTK